MNPESSQLSGERPVNQPPIAKLLLVLYLILFAVCAIKPAYRDVWVAENAPIVLLVGILIWIARYQRLSAGAWVWAFFLPALHTIGGHYTFEHVPFGYVSDLFGFERNHFDRMAHFTVGFLAYPFAELTLKRRWIQVPLVGYLFPLFAIMALAGAYELFEWQYAVMGDPDAGAFVLGSQGDIWDAQKDILADTLGALLALAGFAWSARRHGWRFGPA